MRRSSRSSFSRTAWPRRFTRPSGRRRRRPPDRARRRRTETGYEACVLGSDDQTPRRNDPHRVLSCPARRDRPGRGLRLRSLLVLRAPHLALLAEPVAQPDDRGGGAADAADAPRHARQHPYRHPLLVAEEMAMLDNLTEGRVDCGIGRGLKPYEFRAFGQDQEVSREVFTECLEVVRRVWADENFSHEGKYYTCEKNTPLSPPLVQKPHPPLYVSAQSPESVRWAASQDIPFGQIDALVEESKKDQKVYREIQVAHGFAPVPRLFVTREVYVAATDE